MALILIGLAALGFLCVAANLLEAIGRIVVCFLKYIVRPVLIFMLVMFFIYVLKRGAV